MQPNDIFADQLDQVEDADLMGSQRLSDPGPRNSEEGKMGMRDTGVFGKNRKPVGRAFESPDQGEMTPTFNINGVQIRGFNHMVENAYFGTKSLFSSKDEIMDGIKKNIKTFDLKNDKCKKFTLILI
jgi:hypothetical protein